ncbi:MAG TPA: hypothetical protein VMW25_03870 [Clostridia bacterium]|nr:hypothetical protein [Clostridia bacterium]
MKIKYQKFLAITTLLALVFGTFVPSALAFTSAEILGNGAGSENEVEVEKEQETVVVQDNWAEVKNVVNARVVSGGNEANGNTNGEVFVGTGAATANINLNTKVNSNVAKVEDCDGCEEEIKAKISGNGADSENEIEMEFESDVSVFQENKAKIENSVCAKAVSGENEANANTGDDVAILTGDATVNTNVNNQANANVTKVGDDSFEFENDGFVSAEILDNGAWTENEIEIEHRRSVLVSQENVAYIMNKIKAEALSGKNKAKYNTNGEVVIDTGAATANLNLNNKANFNFAKVECCELELWSKIAGNGADTENEVEFKQAEFLSVFQNGGDNDKEKAAFLSNWLAAKPVSGLNSASDNTDPDKVDPVIVTGPATANVNVNNESGANVYGSKDSQPEAPDWPQFSFEFDFGKVWGFFFR